MRHLWHTISRDRDEHLIQIVVTDTQDMLQVIYGTNWQEGGRRRGTLMVMSVAATVMMMTMQAMRRAKEKEREKEKEEMSGMTASLPLLREE